MNQVFGSHTFKGPGWRFPNNQNKISSEINYLIGIQRIFDQVPLSRNYYFDLKFTISLNLYLKRIPFGIVDQINFHCRLLTRLPRAVPQPLMKIYIVLSYFKLSVVWWWWSGLITDYNTTQGLYWGYPRLWQYCRNLR